MQESPAVRALLGHDPWPDVKLSILSRECNKCNVEKLVEDFIKATHNTNGIGAICKECKNAARRNANISEEKRVATRKYEREYRLKNPDLYKASNKGWKKRNRETVLANKKRYREANRERSIALVKAWHVANREYMREYYRTYNKYVRVHKRESHRVHKSHNCRKTQYIIGNSAHVSRRTIHSSVNVHKRINKALHSRVRHFLKTGKLAKELLGCDFSNLKLWFELNFYLDAHLGMNWENYGKVWEIDHVRACITFDMGAYTDYKNCFHWTNLAPVTIHHNRSKGGRIKQADETRQAVRLTIYDYIIHKQAPGTAIGQ